MGREAYLVDLTLVARLEMIEALARRARGRLSELRRGAELPIGPGAIGDVRAALRDLAGELPELARALDRLLAALDSGSNAPAGPGVVLERRRSKLRTG
jgi:hypothetical protein